jgi:hypothetical protein
MAKLSGGFRSIGRLGIVALVLAGVLGTAGIVVAAATAGSGKGVTAVKTVTANAAGTLNVTSTTFTDMADMSLSISVPADTTAMLLITFSAETLCSGVCRVRALVDGNIVQPGELIFQTAGASWGANSMQFVAASVAAGPHTVKIQARTDSSFLLDVRTLTLLRIKK